jgi:hypothetical protein
VDQILVSCSFKDWLQEFFYNPSAFVDIAKGQTSNVPAHNLEPGLIDKNLFKKCCQ